jgi:tRNA nucleotidyltransferase/poly(A) polymerase
MKRIHDARFGVWVVGGALRDLLLGIEPKDWDLATSASPENIISIFPKVIPVGIRHGTVQVHTRARDIEVTSCESPGEAGILKDLGRRDFTINSLALSYPDGFLIDPNGGREDLKAGLVRAVANPAARFSEDPLRLVRAARMCGVYGFKIDPATFEAMRQRAGELVTVSGERVRDEILKILPAEHTLAAFDLLKNIGALDKLLPGLANGPDETRESTGLNIYEHTLCCILNCPKRVRIRLGALFHILACPVEHSAAGALPVDSRVASALAATRVMKKWNMSNKSIDEISSLISHQLPPEAPAWSDSEIRRFITTVRPGLLDDFLALAEAEVLCAKDWGSIDKIVGARAADSQEPAGHAGWAGSNRAKQSPIDGISQLGVRMRTQLETISAMSVRELALSGSDLMKLLDLPPGPQVGKILNYLFEMVLADPELNTRKHLIRMALAKFK